MPRSFDELQQGTAYLVSELAAAGFATGPLDPFGGPFSWPGDANGFRPWRGTIQDPTTFQLWRAWDTRSDKAKQTFAYGEFYQTPYYATPAGSGIVWARPIPLGDPFNIPKAAPAPTLSELQIAEAINAANAEVNRLRSVYGRPGVPDDRILISDNSTLKGWIYATWVKANENARAAGASSPPFPQAIGASVSNGLNFPPPAGRIFSAVGDDPINVTLEPGQVYPFNYPWPTGSYSAYSPPAGAFYGVGGSAPLPYRHNISPRLYYGPAATDSAFDPETTLAPETVDSAPPPPPPNLGVVPGGGSSGGGGSFFPPAGTGLVSSFPAGQTPISAAPPVPSSAAPSSGGAAIADAAGNAVAGAIDAGSSGRSPYFWLAAVVLVYLATRRAR